MFSNMYTEEEFQEAWKHLYTKQRKFVLAYLETLDPKESAKIAGYSKAHCAAPVYRIMRKVGKVIDYLIEKNNIVQNICKPAFIMNEYIKLYQNTQSQITKQNVLKQLSKILNMQTQGTTLQIHNNIPKTPVQIVFNEEE